MQRDACAQGAQRPGRHPARLAPGADLQAAACPSPPTSQKVTAIQSSAYFRILQKERPSLPSSAFCREVHPNCCVRLSCSFLLLCEDNTTHFFVQCPRRRGCLSVWGSHKQGCCGHSCEFSPAGAYTVLQTCVCVCAHLFSHLFYVYMSLLS